MVTSQEVKELFSSLSTVSQTALLSELLQEQELEGKVLESAKEAMLLKRDKKPCPHCSSEKVYKRGSQKGVQMYSCRACKKWYSETTGTALESIKLKEKWQSYLNCMEQGLTIEKSAKEVGICIQTSFDWRHKILSSLTHLVPDELSSDVECDELELAINEKGSRSLNRDSRQRGTDSSRNKGGGEPTVVQVVTAVERKGKKYLRAVESKRLSKEEIEVALDGKLSDGATLITDKHPSYRAYMKDKDDVRHKTLRAKDHVDKKDKSIHLQKVNNVHAQLRQFLQPFNGVSSKYLQNYLNWYAYSDQLRKSKETLKQWLLVILTADQGYALFQAFKENAVLIRI